MRHRRANRKPQTKIGSGPLLRLVATAFCLVAICSPVGAVTHVGIFGGFAIGAFPAPYANGGTLSTEDSLNPFHVWSTYVLLDVEERTFAGTGPFTIHRTSGAVGDPGEIIQGYWEARSFNSWRSIGLCRDFPLCLTAGSFPVDAFPPNFNAGKFRGKIILYDEAGEKLGKAVLIIYCSLPGIPYGRDARDPMGRGIEQYRVKIISGELAGLDFVVGRSGTVFVDCREPGLPC